VSARQDSGGVAPGRLGEARPAAIERPVLLERLRDEIRRIERRPARRDGVLRCGRPEIDGALPGGGFRRGGLTALAGELRFVDGQATNPANQTKNNLQADSTDPRYTESVQIVAGAFARSREFASYAMPKRVAPPLLWSRRRPSST